MKLKADRKILAIAAILTLVAIGLAIRWVRRRKKIGDIMVRNITNELPTGTRKYTSRKLEDIDQVIIHHSATNSGSASAFARFHVNERGWPGIGYHFVIAKDGTVDQVNDLETISYHTSGQNGRSIGICLTGNYDIQRPPVEQIDACIRLIRGLSEELGRRLSVRGHRQFAAKSCPGNNIDVAWLEEQAYKEEV